ncbi:hypothetical protein ACWGOQ_0001350 [Aquimarina sp. M1]
MKTKFKNISVIIMMAVTIMFQSCSNDDEVIIENEDQLEDIQNRVREQQESIQNIDTPEAMDAYIGDDVYASSASIYLVSLKSNALAISEAFLQIPDTPAQQSSLAKNSATTDVWVWSFGGLTLYYTVTSDANFDYFAYDIEEAGVRRTLYEGKISKDGNYFDVTVYEDDGITVLSIITYRKMDNIIELDIVTGDNSLELTYNETDRSGTIEVYSAGVLSESYVWLSNGTGTYTNHATGETFSWP